MAENLGEMDRADTPRPPGNQSGVLAVDTRAARSIRSTPPLREESLDDAGLRVERAARSRRARSKRDALATAFRVAVLGCRLAAVGADDVCARAEAATAAAAKEGGRTSPPL